MIETLETAQTTEQDTSLYGSHIIRARVAKLLGDESLEDFIDPKYHREVQECLDILDIDYPATAIGILGRILENCTKDYFEKIIKSKNLFSVNSANLPIKTIRKYFTSNHSKQKNRLDLLNQKEIKINNNSFKLKRKYLTNEYYNILIDIKDARNDAFHGCYDDEFKELEMKSYILIERGIHVLVLLQKQINT